MGPIAIQALAIQVCCLADSFLFRLSILFTAVGSVGLALFFDSALTEN